MMKKSLILILTGLLNANPIKVKPTVEINMTEKERPSLDINNQEEVERYREYLKKNKITGFDRMIKRSDIEEISGYFLGRPCKEKKTSEMLNEKVIIHWDTLNSLDYICDVAAIKNVKSRGELLSELQKTRYKKNIIDTKNRYHSINDWVRNTPYYRDITKKITKKLGYSKRNSIPKKFITLSVNKLRKGDIFVLLHKKREYTNAGFIIGKSDGVYLRTASKRYGKVIEVKLKDHINQSYSEITGYKILRPNQR